MINKSPAFNLKAVLRETGLTADTLRAWERRYGLPLPKRTAGGHRLYSQYDIETIKWLTSKQADGLSISRAVDLWNEICASGTDPLTDSAYVILNLAAQESKAQPLSNVPIDIIRTEWVFACMNFDEQKAEQTLNKAFSMFRVEDVCIEVLQRGLSDIGNLWHGNQSTIQQEHFASGLAMRRLDALLSASPIPSDGLTVLVGCPAGEWHSFTPLLFTYLLRRLGLRTIYLGANVPTDRLAQTVKNLKADLVVLVSQTLISAATLQQTAFALTNQNIPFAFGGRIFNLRPNIIDYIPGYFLGNEIEAGSTEVMNVINHQNKPINPKPISEEYHAALHGFNTNRILIENTLKMKMQPLSISPEELNTSLRFLGDNITAALQLGDIDHMNQELEWVKTLLFSRKFPPQEFIRFIHNYSNAVDEHINGQGDPIKTWLMGYKEST